jgi:hypothetical protein
LSSKKVDIYIPFSKTEKKLKRKRSLKTLSLTKQGHPMDIPLSENLENVKGHEQKLLRQDLLQEPLLQQREAAVRLALLAESCCTPSRLACRSRAGHLKNWLNVFTD